MKGNEVADDVVFTFNDKECKVPEAKLYLCTYKNLYGSTYDYDLWDGNFDSEALNAYIKDITLAELERIYVIDGLAEQQEIELTEFEISHINTIAKEYFDSLTEGEKSYIGGNVDDVVTAYMHYALAVKVYESMTEGRAEEVSDDEARVITVQMIFVSSEDSAKTVEQKLTSVDEFENIAASYNEKSSIEVNMARGEYPIAVEEKAFSLDEGEMTSKIQTEDGFYFVKCINKFNEELTDINKEKIKLQKQQAKFDDHFAEVVESATFHINMDLWNSFSCITEYEINVGDFFARYDN